MPENLQMQNLYSNMKYNLLQKKLQTTTIVQFT
jgi:hypothetical protein